MARPPYRQLAVTIVFASLVIAGLVLVNRPQVVPESKTVEQPIITTRQAVIERRLQALEEYQRTGQRSYEYDATNLPPQGKEQLL